MISTAYAFLIVFNLNIYVNLFHPTRFPLKISGRRGRIDFHLFIILVHLMIIINTLIMHWLLKKLRSVSPFHYISHLLLDYLQDTIEVLHRSDVASITDEGIHGLENFIIAH